MFLSAAPPQNACLELDFVESRHYQMALKKITPIHKSIQVIDDTMKQLLLQRAALVSLLPTEKERRKQGQHYIINPITKEKGYY